MKNFFDSGLAQRYGYGIAVYIAARTADLQRGIERQMSNAAPQAGARSKTRKLKRSSLSCVAKEETFPPNRARTAPVYRTQMQLVD
ncbi:hypothetical protein [Paraburkholderia franconis]|uniref:hypothetical protein n=1 Tax=Paraburkholderia franconis TaxID=2654983 RepID=UPI001D110CF7|nr:hypothetical protein [Paraburkholderia franconis]